MKIGQHIKVYLEENGIKQSYLCKETKITPSRMSLMLSEKRRMTFEDYYKICKALNVQVGTFIESLEPEARSEH